jgi:hypothetical protein
LRGIRRPCRVLLVPAHGPTAHQAQCANPPDGRTAAATPPVAGLAGCLSSAPIKACGALNWVASSAAIRRQPWSASEQPRPVAPDLLPLPPMRSRGQQPQGALQGDGDRLPRTDLPQVLTELVSMVRRSGLATCRSPSRSGAHRRMTSGYRPAYQQQTAYLAIHRCCRMPRGVRSMPSEESRKDHFGGRPQWGKMHGLSAPELASGCLDSDDFIAVRDRFDPPAALFERLPGPDPGALIEARSHARGRVRRVGPVQGPRPYSRSATASLQPDQGP